MSCVAMSPLKRELVCLLIAPPPKKKNWFALQSPRLLTIQFFCTLVYCKSYCSAKCFGKTRCCLVHKVKDLLPSNISCPFLVLLYILHSKFQDLVNAQPYQTQLDQQSKVNIEKRCSYIFYSTSALQE